MPNEINAIYFPTDFSYSAGRALPFAAEIARATGAVLTLVHAVEEPFDLSPGVKAKKKKIKEEINGKFDDLVEDLRGNQSYENLEIHTVLISGQPTVNLLALEQEKEPDLIVMGTRGSGGRRNLMLGSMATAVLSQSSVPVMVVPPESEFDGLSRVLFATDYHGGDPEALHWLVSFADAFDAEVETVHIAPGPSFELELKHRGFRSLVNDSLDGAELPAHLEYNSDIYDGLSEFMNERPTSLLVMVRYKKPFFESLFSTAHTRQMGFFIHKPLLVLPGEQLGA